MNEIMQYCLSLFALFRSSVSSGFIYIVANDRISFLLFMAGIAFHCLCITWAIRSSVDRQTSKLFHVLGVVNSNTANMRVQISLLENYLVSRSWLAGVYNSSFLEGPLYCFHRSCTDLHSHQPCPRSLLSPHSVNILSSL